MPKIFQLNNTLQPKVWSDEQLDPDISDKLIQIAEEFFQDLGLEGAEIEDITFTGSLANYNWTKFSDIDLHIIVDFKKIDENFNLVREYFTAKTSLWNKTHEIMVRGHEIELYVQDLTEKHHSTGVYSLKNQEWLTKPVKVTPKVDTDMVKRKIKSFIDMIERVEDTYDDKKYKQAHEESVNLARKIKKFRQSGLEDRGEYSNENLAFKFLRNNGNIKKLYDVRNMSYDKMLSLEDDYEKNFKIFLNKDEYPVTKGFNRLQEEEKFQKRLKKRHSRMKRRLISLGGQRNVPPFSKKPKYKRGKSSPPGFGGS